jgi:hypothetical protein
MRKIALRALLVVFLLAMLFGPRPSVRPRGGQRAGIPAAQRPWAVALGWVAPRDAQEAAWAPPAPPAPLVDDASAQRQIVRYSLTSEER